MRITDEAKVRHLVSEWSVYLALTDYHKDDSTEDVESTEMRH